MNDPPGALEALLRDAIAATRIAPPASFSWFGRRESAVVRRVAGHLTTREQTDALHRSLALRLYEAFYCRGRAVPVPPVRGALFEHAWVERLSRANRSRGCVDEGWRIAGRQGGVLIVTKGGIRLAADPSALRRRGRDGIAISVPNERRRLSPGYYMAVSEAPLPHEEPLFRVYWNLQAAGAPRLVRRATELLNRAELPFRLKVTAHPEAFDRCDAGVLYALRRDSDRVFDVLAALHPQLRRYLKPDVPVFTKRVAPGIGVAEDPQTGESFGENRCAILARALVGCGEIAQAAERLDRVRAAFARRSVPLDRVFLDRGSSDVYPLLVRSGTPTRI